MFTTADHIDNIIAKLAHLKYTLELHGKDGSLSLHKHSELVLRDLLTLIYGYRLEILGKNSRFPAVDLGSEKDGVAVQVTVRNDNEKVNASIDKFLKYGLQQTFPRMIVVVINNKLAKYPLKPFSDPNFKFDPATDIIDLDDLVQKIKSLMPIQVQAVGEYLAKEFPAIVPAASDPGETFLIDVDSDKSARQLAYHFHSAVKIGFDNAGLSAAKLYRWLNEYFNTAQKRFLHFNIFNEQYRKRSTNSSDIIFEMPLYDESARNYAKHSVIRIMQDCIQIEFASYYTDADHNSNLEDEIGPMLSVLLALPALKFTGENLTSVTYRYDTNGKMRFYNQQSPLAVNTYMQIFYIDKQVTVKTQFKIADDDALCDLLQEIADTFINEPLPFQKNQPYMSFDRPGQVLTLNHIRARIQPTLGEII